MPRRYVPDHAIMDERRRRVAAMKAAGYTNRQVVESLKRSGFVNPATGKPFSLNTVALDVLTLKARWQEEAGAAVSEHRARLLAELRLLKREAWAREDLREVGRVLDLEARLLGLNAPPKQPVPWCPKCGFLNPRRSLGYPEPAGDAGPTAAQEMYLLEQEIRRLEWEARELEAERREIEADLEAEDGEDAAP